MEEKNIYAELSSIRELMERSSKFISLSGLSGVLAGVYALAGAGLSYWLINDKSGANYEESYTGEPVLFWQLFAIAVIVLVISIATCVWFSMRKAKKAEENIWNPVSRRLLAATGVPLVTGGMFILIMLAKGEFAYIAAACLIFYGLALVAGSHYTFTDVKWLGICQILLGLLALALPQHGLALWALGFGLMHILYGSIIHFKYEK